MMINNDWLTISETQLESALGKALGPNIDAADLFLQQIQDESWMLEDGIVKEGGFRENLFKKTMVPETLFYSFLSSIFNAYPIHLIKI